MAELPGIRLAEQLCESLLPEADMEALLLRAVMAHGVSDVLVASHTLSLRMDEMAAPVTLHRMTSPLAEAARLTCTHHIGVLAQPPALSHPRMQAQLGLFAERGLKITTLPVPELTYMAHRYQTGGRLPDLATLRDMMAPIRADARIDTVVLATSSAYPLRGMLEKAAFRPFYWVDGATAAARRYKALQVESEKIVSLRS
ncbi:MAG: hypothetical protein KGQ41_05080 [Alphaproteobacteria bacterium]|nr:hypothetical protein [Alphaproteobacteria bacterium]